MKYKLLIVIILFCFNVSRAQDKKFSLKPALGVTASQVHGDNYAGYNKLGFIGGLYVNSYFSKTLSLDLGLIFVQKGSRHNQNPEKNDFKYYYLNLNYLEVPVILRYAPNKFFLTIGVSYAYLVNYYEASESGNQTGFYPFNKSEYSLNAGVGMSITKKIDFEVRANNSFMTIRPFGGNFAPYYNNFLARWFNKGFYNNVLQLVFTYKISPSKKSEQTED